MKDRALWNTIFRRVAIQDIHDLIRQHPLINSVQKQNKLSTCEEEITPCHMWGVMNVLKRHNITRKG